MSSKLYPIQNSARSNLFALSVACPFDQSNPEDCPLFALRQMKPRERLAWFNALNDDDLWYLAAYHNACLNARVKTKMAECRR